MEKKHAQWIVLSLFQIFLENFSMHFLKLKLIEHITINRLKSLKVLGNNFEFYNTDFGIEKIRNVFLINIHGYF